MKSLFEFTAGIKSLGSGVQRTIIFNPQWAIPQQGCPMKSAFDFEMFAGNKALSAWSKALVPGDHQLKSTVSKKTGVSN